MSETRTHQSNPAERWLSRGSVFAALGSFIGASCCVLPILLVNIGVSSALVSNLAFFVRARPYLLAGTIVLIVLGMYIAFRNGRPKRSTTMILCASVVIAAAALILPAYEPELQSWLLRS